MSKVSVIVPVYNNEAYVEKCLRSVMQQTYANLEIIVINDGSTDKSGEIIRQLSVEDSRIILLNQENCGVSAARNRGLDAVTGEYLTFIDGDDYVSPDYIENLYESMQAQQVDMLICGFSFVGEDNKILRTIIPGEYERYRREEWTFRISAVCAHFYRTEIWKKYNVRFFIGERGEDMPISLFFSAICDKIGVLQKAGYYYVQHKSSAMHNFKGLKKYRLPYCALEQTINKIEMIGVANSPEFYELFVLRILCTCLFNLANKASRKDVKELCDYIMRILNIYFPLYYRNRYTRLISNIDVPFVQKVAVKFLIILVKTKLIYPVSRVWSK